MDTKSWEYIRRLAYRFASLQQCRSYSNWRRYRVLELHGPIHPVQDKPVKNKRGTKWPPGRLHSFRHALQRWWPRSRYIWTYIWTASSRSFWFGRNGTTFSSSTVVNRSQKSNHQRGGVTVKMLHLVHGHHLIDEIIFNIAKANIKETTSGNGILGAAIDASVNRLNLISGWKNQCLDVRLI